MLVLSRRPDESIVFPNVGVTVRVVRINGNVVRIGVDAPRDLAVLRGELAEGQPLPAPRPTPSHELCNRLSRISLALHLAQRQRDLGMHTQADISLNEALDALAALDRDWLRENVRGSTVPAPDCRALVVDDDANERELLAGVLRMYGCECETAADGDEALANLERRGRPDVVLLDMWMPRLDGPRTLASIRSDPRWAGLTVFSVSSTAPEEVGLVRGPGGIDGWFPKPLKPAVLCDAIRAARTVAAG
jgi:carbon storage regulator CsrA